MEGTVHPSMIHIRNSGEISDQSMGDKTSACAEFSEIKESHSGQILEIFEKHCYILSTIVVHWMMFNREGDEIKHIK